MTTITENFKTVRTLIQKAEKNAARKEGSITLTAVSKTQSQEALTEALAAGQRVFGENRVQEAYEHWSTVKQFYADLRLHLIGPLQTNKVRDAAALFDCIETLDREKLALAFKATLLDIPKDIEFMIQVNTGQEPQKAGVDPTQLKEFHAFCIHECGLNVRGLMCIPPVEDRPAMHFALLANYARQLDLPYLSMGMSHDFETAIALGATHVRIGTALFGARKL